MQWVVQLKENFELRGVVSFQRSSKSCTDWRHVRRKQKKRHVIWHRCPDSRHRWSLSYIERISIVYRQSTRCSVDFLSSRAFTRVSCWHFTRLRRSKLLFWCWSRWRADYWTGTNNVEGGQVWPLLPVGLIKPTYTSLRLIASHHGHRSSRPPVRLCPSFSVAVILRTLCDL